MAVCSLLPKKACSLQENLKKSWHVDHPTEQCRKALEETFSVARELSLDTLHISVQTGRNGNKHAMIPTRQDVVLTAAVAENAAAADTTRGAVEPTAADDATRGAVESTAVDDDA